jgi:hypothetical protein
VSDAPVDLPYRSADGSFQILALHQRMIFSVLDVAVTSTPKGMEVLEQRFGKDLTTRNWNTLEKLAAC